MVVCTEYEEPLSRGDAGVASVIASEIVSEVASEEASEEASGIASGAAFDAVFAAASVAASVDAFRHVARAAAQPAAEDSNRASKCSTTGVPCHNRLHRAVGGDLGSQGTPDGSSLFEDCCDGIRVQ